MKKNVSDFILTYRPIPGNPRGPCKTEHKLLSYLKWLKSKTYFAMYVNGEWWEMCVWGGGGGGGLGGEVAGRLRDTKSQIHVIER